MSHPTPPRLAHWVIARLTPANEREFWLGDLEEQFADRAGADPRAARVWYRRQAWRAVTHRIRRAEGGNVLEGTVQDARYAARSLRRSPGFVVLATLTLALGIGATAMIYAVVDHVLVRGLPFDDADRLVVVRNGYTDGRPGTWLVSFPDYEDYLDAVTGFEQLAAWQEQSPALASEDGAAAQRLNAVDATANLLPMLGVEPILGRGFLPEEDHVDAPQRAAILSHSLWQTRFGADEQILGQRILLDETPYTVVGVLPLGFTGVTGGFVLASQPIDIWLPYRASFSRGGMTVRGLTNVNLIGKVGANTTYDQVFAEAQALGGTLDEQFPDLRNNIGPQFHIAQRKAVESVERQIWLSFGAVSLLLIIACANVANLLIGRASHRQREMALRTALGGGRVRLLRQLVIESLLVAAAGATAGVGIAYAGLRLLAANRALEIASIDTVVIDGRILVFLFLVAAVAGLLFGVGPALFATSRPPADTLRSEGRAVTGTRSYVRRGLVVGQLALSLVLLIGAGLLGRSLQTVMGIDPGFEPRGVITARIQLPMDFVSADWPRAVEVVDQFTERARQLPGVRSAAATYQLPTSPGWNNAFDIDPVPIAPVELAAGEQFQARFSPVTPGYFETVGVRLLRGRTFTDADGVDGNRVVVVNQRFADMYFGPGVDPIGARLQYGNWWQGGPPEYEIVGVVENVLFAGRDGDTYQATYFPHAQQPVREMNLVVAADGDPLELVPALRAQLQELDPTLPLDDPLPLGAHLAESDEGRRSLAVMLGVFAISAATLAAIGVYGVMAFLVTQRTREMGIRVALGARTHDVRSMVLGAAMRLAAAGIVLGLAGAWLLGGIVERLLFGVPPVDLMTWTLVAAFLGAVALAASWLPARRATATDPMSSLRSD
ncbi:MAG: FtsX-like permease family protein [Acidobacteria bacterium]|nr:FtsX-like permease family protein [Acidobacteriota bacterium]